LRLPAILAIRFNLATQRHEWFQAIQCVEVQLAADDGHGLPDEINGRANHILVTNRQRVSCLIEFYLERLVP